MLEFIISHVQCLEHILCGVCSEMVCLITGRRPHSPPYCPLPYFNVNSKPLKIWRASALGLLSCRCEWYGYGCVQANSVNTNVKSAHSWGHPVNFKLIFSRKASSGVHFLHWVFDFMNTPSPQARVKCSPWEFQPFKPEPESPNSAKAGLNIIFVCINWIMDININMHNMYFYIQIT